MSSRYLLRKLRRYTQIYLALCLILATLIISWLALFQSPKKISKASGISSQALLEAVNLERTKNGIHALQLNPLLTQAATTKALEMQAQNYFSHYSSTGKRGVSFVDDQGYSYQKVAENLAIYYESEQEVVSAWMDSAGHRQNIMDYSFTETGLAAVEGRYNNFETTFIVQFFAQPLPKATPKQTQPETPINQPSTKQPAVEVKTDTPTKINQPVIIETPKEEVKPTPIPTPAKINNSEKPKVILNYQGLLDNTFKKLENLLKNLRVFVV